MMAMNTNNPQRSTNDDDSMYFRFIKDLVLMDITSSIKLTNNDGGKNWRHSSIESELCDAISAMKLDDECNKKSYCSSQTVDMFNDFYDISGDSFSPKRNSKSNKLQQADQDHCTKSDAKLEKSSFSVRKKEIVPEIKISDNDVLVMRGYFASNRPANLKYRDLILSKKASYDSGDRKNKTALTWQVIEEVEGKGGRFVMQEKVEGKYYLVRRRDMRRKVAQSFRDIRRKIDSKV